MVQLHDWSQAREVKVLETVREVGLERYFPGAREDGEVVTRDLNVDVREIVLPRRMRGDAFEL